MMEAPGSTSIANATQFHHFPQLHGLAAASTTIGKPLLGEVNVFEIVEMLQDGFASIIALASPGALGKLSRRASTSGGRQCEKSASSRPKLGLPEKPFLNHLVDQASRLDNLHMTLDFVERVISKQLNEGCVHE
jgi:hypothetical protein